MSKRNKKNQSKKSTRVSLKTCVLLISTLGLTALAFKVDNPIKDVAKEPQARINENEASVQNPLWKQMPRAQVMRIANQVSSRETGGKFDTLVHMNPTESGMCSIGIGHFIWLSETPEYRVT